MESSQAIESLSGTMPQRLELADLQTAGYNAAMSPRSAESDGRPIQETPALTLISPWKSIRSYEEMSSQDLLRRDLPARRNLPRERI